MRTVRVMYHREGDAWWADSPDVPGWSAAGDSIDEVYALVEGGISFHTDDDVHLLHMTFAAASRATTIGAPSKMVITKQLPLASAGYTSRPTGLAEV